MNPELEQLKKRVSDLEQAQNINAVQSLLDVFIKNVDSVTDADVTLSLSDSVGAEGGTVNFDVLDFPDRWLTVRYNGTLYRLPAYIIDR